MKSDMMKYKGYRATISFDEEDKIFVGEVFGIADSLNFHGRSIDELEEAFHDSIENYLEICEKIGKNPQKEFSGTFNVRTTPALHKQTAEYAADNGITRNQTISRALESCLGKQVKV
jgi:predicted HicB family RNase H-like nuclease